MKKQIYLPLLFIAATFFWNCDGGSDDQNAVLALLLNKKCINVPKKVIVIDANTSNTIIEYECSVSGKEYLCESASDTQSRVYSSIEGAQLGVVNPPGGGGFCFFPSQRGLGRSLGYQTFSPTSIMYNCEYTYDSAHRLTAVFDQENSISKTYGDYNFQGFPLDASGDSASYSFSGSELPTEIQFASSEISYDSKGWAISLVNGPDFYFFENQGSLQVCD